MTRPPRHLGLHHVALFVEDLDAVRHFYVDLLGFEVEWQPDPDNIYLTSGSDNLALHRGAAPEGQQRLDHIGVILASPEHVALWESFLRAHDVEVLRPTKKHRDGATSFYAADPTGAVVQFIYHPPISPKLSRIAGEFE